MRMDLLMYISQKIKLNKFISILIFLFISCYSVSRNCKDFHEGEFLFKSIINGEIKTSKFIRKKNIEIEIFENKIDTAKIKWVNECECILTKLNPLSNQEKRPIQIKIISTKKDSYVFEYSLVGDLKNIRRGKIIKIK
jgi:hypothetical protein